MYKINASQMTFSNEIEIKLILSSSIVVLHMQHMQHKLHRVLM